MKRNTSEPLVALVTGASSGIGFETARALARQGYKVYAAARRVALMEPLAADGVVPVALDLTSAESIRQCVDTVGQVDLLVNNAGYGYFGAIENVPMDDARRQLEVNLFGMAELCRAVIPGMRERGRGRIVNVGSVAGRCVLYFGGWYHVSKYAVEALSDALRMELKPFGVDVVLIEPGSIRTAWGGIAAENLRTSSRGTAYEGPAIREADAMSWLYERPIPSKPGVVVRAILRACHARRPRARYHPGIGARLLIFVHWLLPARWWDALIRRTLAGRLAGRFSSPHS